MSSYQLMEKTELRIERIGLHGANLTDVAAVVADTLGIARDDVYVIDVRDDRLALDIHRRTLDPYQVVGQERRLLASLGRLPGVAVSERTTIAAEGVLGWIGDDPATAHATLDRAERMADEIRRTIARRAIVFPTGAELVNGQVLDTNTPHLAATLTAAGFSVTPGTALPDSLDRIAGALAEAAEDRGFGLVVTTGGVGAEDKDTTIEALLRLDPAAATPAICSFRKGTGRHHKDGVRIGVGRLAAALIVSLPGPHDEVRLGAAALLSGLTAGLGPDALADHIAEVLRDRLRAKAGEGHHR